MNSQRLIDWCREDKLRFEDSIETDLAKKLDYGGYLHLDALLAAQEPLSRPMHHDEMLFIIQHQTSELWMKLLIHELQAAISHVKADELEPSLKILARVKQVQRMMFEQWAVLETLTPSEYAQFRHVLGPASGLQSHQYRAIEFLFGNKDEAMIRVFQHKPEAHAVLEAVLHQPSIYDELLRYLHRKGFSIPRECIERDWSQPYAEHPDLILAIKKVYDAPRDHWAEYEMFEKLIDVEEAQVLWRVRHLKTVERIIGFKRGTGGSSGAAFLRKGIDVRLFPELWDVRTEIGA
jgi:tryptophan 2,3-dioxygenase